MCTIGMLLRIRTESYMKDKNKNKNENKNT